MREDYYRNRVILRHQADQQTAGDLACLRHNIGVLASTTSPTQRARLAELLAWTLDHLEDRLTAWQAKGLEAIREAAKENGPPPVVAGEQENNT